MLACPDRSLFCGADQPQIAWSEYDGRLVLKSVKLVADGQSPLPPAPLPFFSSSELSTGFVYFLQTGALGSWGAAMLEPYSDRTDGWRGIMLAPEERFGPLIKEWNENGWQVVRLSSPSPPALLSSSPPALTSIRVALPERPRNWRPCQPRRPRRLRRLPLSRPT